jgi:hypothetical protein
LSKATKHKIADEIATLNKYAQESNCEYASMHHTQYQVHLAEQVMKADIIHLHWIADWLDYTTFFGAVKKPIVWTFHDENPFRGIILI